MGIYRNGIYINTISGGIVNFGGAISIAPISITKETAGSGSSNAGSSIVDNPEIVLNRFGRLAGGAAAAIGCSSTSGNSK